MSDKLINHGSGIIEIRKFVSDSDTLLLHSYVKSVVEDKWYNEGDPPHWAGKASRVYLHAPDYIRKIINAIELKISTTILNYSSINLIQDFLRLREGDFLGRHRDNANPSDFNNVYGLVVYLNDNYDGGELYYKDIDFKLKPTAGSLLIHPAGLEHEVLVVTSGVRFMVTSFVKGDNLTEVIGK